MDMYLAGNPVGRTGGGLSRHTGAWGLAQYKPRGQKYKHFLSHAQPWTYPQMQQHNTSYAGEYVNGPPYMVSSRIR